MSTKEIKDLIDYFASTQSNSTSLIISGLALLVSIIAIAASWYTFKKQRDSSLTDYLSIIWNDVIDKCLDNPQYLDITKTKHYYRIMDNDDVLKYEAYCYKLWGHVEDIVINNKQDDNKFEPIIRWVTTYHYTWLERNPAFFSYEPFWKEVEKMRKQPQMVFGYRKLPSKNGVIDWDVVCEDYYGYILSPFAPEMVSPYKDEKSRNLILGYLKSIPPLDLQEMKVLDFGCGPGNLIPHVSNSLTKLDGIDKSQKSINKAKEIASLHKGLSFKAICSDLLDFSTDEKYDLIISSNSVLPKSRSEVIEIFIKIRDLLKVNGKFVAILPSFDTTIYLKSLWCQRSF